MLFVYSCSILVLLLSQNIDAKDGRPMLPNWATPEELSIAKQGWVARPSPSHAPYSNSYSLRNSVEKRNIFRPSLNLGSTGFRAPAEYEPIAAVQMTYAGWEDLLGNISVSIAQSGTEVWMVGGPDSIPGVPPELYKRLDLEYDSIWSRDYGPIGLVVDSTAEVGIIDTIYRHYRYRLADDDIPCSIADKMDSGCYQAPLVLDGGNTMFDGNGHLFMTDITYMWNSNLPREKVDEILKNYFGVHTIHAFGYARAPPDHYWYHPDGSSPADGTGHIDMFVKIVSPCKVIITQSDDYLFQEILEDAAEYFDNLPCDESETGFYDVYRIEGWYDHDNFVWYTYTNSLIVNGIVIVPHYWGGDNENAMDIYRQTMPNYQVVSHNTDESIVYGGSIHCLTRDIPL